MHRYYNNLLNIRLHRAFAYVYKGLSRYAHSPYITVFSLTYVYASMHFSISLLRSYARHLTTYVSSRYHLYTPLREKLPAAQQYLRANVCSTA